MSDENGALVTVSQAAAILGLHRNSVERRIKTGRYRVEWAPGPRGPQKFIRRSDLDRSDDDAPADLPDNPGPDLSYHPAAVEPSRDLAPLFASYDHLIADLRALERQAGELTARNAALEAHNAAVSDELAQCRAELMHARTNALKRSWRVITGKQP